LSATHVHFAHLLEVFSADEGLSVHDSGDRARKETAASRALAERDCWRAGVAVDTPRSNASKLEWSN